MAEPSTYRPTEIPELPGVYRFFNAKDEPIYVGKAVNLKARLSTYFQSGLAQRTHRMVHEATRVDWTIVGTEVEALQLEFSWIKQFSPAYNVQFRDDKSYPYLGISIEDEFPRIFITRKSKRPGVKYFGPYTHAWALRSTFEVLLKVFPIRSCTTETFKKAQKSNRQCLLGDIGKCCAPCVNWVTPAEHRELAERLVSFMSDGSQEIVQTLREEMALASSREEFERATKIRDQIAALVRSQESTDAALPVDLSADFIAIHEEGVHAAGSLFVIRGGLIKGSRSWIVDQERALEGDDQVGSLFHSIYSQSSPSDIPYEIYINQLPADFSALQSWLSLMRGGSVKIKIPQRGEKVELLGSVKRNAHSSLIQYLSKRASDVGVSGKALNEIASILNLEKPPLRIECFDISNISGTSVVASMVVFEDGLAKKSEYRRFIINTNEGFDDTRAMHQVITRRLNRLLSDRAIDKTEVNDLGGRLSKFSYPPQLIVVDGGAPQVSAAARALRELGITDIALCGLAKRLEEVWVYGSSDPLILPRTSEGLYLLQRIRDEAHRFAITFHRSKRSKLMLESALDEIPQLGATRRAALLQRFGSVSAIRKAGLREIASIPGIGAKTAAAIVAYLKSGTSHLNTQTGEIGRE